MNNYKIYFNETIGKCTKCSPKGFILVKNDYAQCSCYKEYLRLKQLHDSGLPRTYWNQDIDNFKGDTSAKKQVIDYMSNLTTNTTKGIGLYLYGSPGVGKTLLASYILQHAIRYSVKVKFYYFTSILNMFTEAWHDDEARREVEESILNCDLLILDDLGREFKSNKKLHEAVLDTVLRTRANQLKPIIVTSNYDILDVKEAYGHGIVDLFKESLVTIKVTGESYRKQKMEDKKK